MKTTIVTLLLSSSILLLSACDPNGGGLPDVAAPGSPEGMMPPAETPPVVDMPPAADGRSAPRVLVEGVAINFLDVVGSDAYATWDGVWSENVRTLTKTPIAGGATSVQRFSREPDLYDVAVLGEDVYVPAEDAVYRIVGAGDLEVIMSGLHWPGVEVVGERLFVLDRDLDAKLVRLYGLDAPYGAPELILEAPGESWTWLISTERAHYLRTREEVLRVTPDGEMRRIEGFTGVFGDVVYAFLGRELHVHDFVSGTDRAVRIPETGGYAHLGARGDRYYWIDFPQFVEDGCGTDAAAEIISQIRSISLSSGAVETHYRRPTPGCIRLAQFAGDELIWAELDVRGEAGTDRVVALRVP